MSADRTRLAHGGNLDEAQRRFPAARHWVDLSTGINPWAYPIGEIDPTLWTRLPEAGLIARAEEAARACYGAPDAARIIAAPGTQAILQMLPRLRRPSRVAVVGFTYQEHAHCWRLGGHEVETAHDVSSACARADVVVVVNPNNPDGRHHRPDGIAEAAARLAERDGWLIVDEAFADVAPEVSVAPLAGHPGLWVLRSFGKFFGLAGLRLGFAVGPRDDGARLSEALGPWAIPGPAADIAARALADPDWIATTRRRLAEAAGELSDTLARGGLEVVGGTDLFRLAATPDASALYDHLCRAGLLVRAFPERPQWLRVGLPPDRNTVARLAAVLDAWRGEPDPPAR